MTTRQPPPDGTVVRALEYLGPEAAMDREPEMVIGPLESRWIDMLAYTAYGVGAFPIDPETVVVVDSSKGRSRRDRSLGLSTMIRRALVSFVDEVYSTGWTGKEREAVSMYAFSHLLPQCSPGEVLFDPGQIGIEVRVEQMPGPPGTRRKQLVTKDLVIWPKPNMSVWNEEWKPVYWPLAIMEWKVRNRPDPEPLSSFGYDLEWLEFFTNRHRFTVGYCISLGIWRGLAKSVDLHCAKVEAGNVSKPWRLHRGKAK